MKRALLLLLLVLAAGTAPSGADFAASSANVQPFSAAADFGVDVTMTNPGSPKRGTVPLSATANETAGGTITQVVFQTSPAGAATWTPACTDSSAAGGWGCNWVTSGNGTYDVRARATSSSGYSRASSPVTGVVIDNSAPTMTFNAPGAWFGGTVSLSGSSVTETGGAGMSGVAYEYKLNSAGTWSSACSSSTGPGYSCNFNASGLTTGSYYDFRATVSDLAGNQTQYTVLNRRADNTIPGGTMTDPGTNIHGSVALGGAPTDGHSGVASITMQYRVTGGSTWSTGCVDNTAPIGSCTWDTTGLNGLYDLRMRVTDAAGNSFDTTPYTSRRVDNDAPTTSITGPAGTLAGTVTVTASATDAGSGVANVAIEWSPAGAGTWTRLCNDGTAAYSCTWTTTAVADGSYDLRAVATDAATNERISTIVTRTVDNPPRAVDVQTTNANTQGHMLEGDAIVFTYSEPIAPASLIAGWDGLSGRAVTVTVTNNTSVNDFLRVYNGASLVPLTTNAGVVLGANHVGGSDAAFNATMTRSGSTITVTLGTLTGGATMAVGAGSMTWNPGTAATDAAGNAVSATPASESGGSDADF